ncbi:uracil-DNA glycosylase-like protein [Amylostereum chailletii]|nr:uracil-DNA glycosylase-like protein [Amylostereum chailletii]
MNIVKHSTMSVKMPNLKRHSTTRLSSVETTHGNVDNSDSFDSESNRLPVEATTSSSSSSSSYSPEIEPPRKRRKLLAGKTPEISATPSASAIATIIESSAVEDMEDLERITMGASWYAAISSEMKKPYFMKLKDFVCSEIKAGTVFPAVNDIYSWSRLTPLDAVKVVVIGQDPYHDVNQAHGLAFSVLPPTKPPPSLKNIYKELKTEFPDTFRIPSTGDLSPLAKLGVLFLNTCLTVRAHKANSHAKKGWEQFTTAALRAVAQRDNPNGVVFFAWGLPAQKTCKAVGIDETKHLVLRSAHPSPLSAYRGFFGNGHFKRANEWLEERYGPGGGINWAALHD